jgi:hypothetical protein
MRFLTVPGLAAVVLVGAAGCAAFPGIGLVPGQSTEADVQAAMGKPVDNRTRTNGEAWLYYSGQPFGRANYVARIGRDARLVAFENRLTDANVATIEKGKHTKEDMRDLFGPPYEVTAYPRMEREVWSYFMRSNGSSGQDMQLYLQFSPDGIVREVYEFSEDSLRNMSGGTGM